MQSLMIRTLLYAASAALVAVGIASAPAMAQPNQMPAKMEKQSGSSPLKLQMEARKISRQLDEIEKKTIQSNPDLQKQRKQLTDHMVKVMKEKGYSPEADRQKLIDLKKSILSGKLKKDERKAKVQKFRTIRSRLQKAQSEAMKDKSLRQESQKLGKSTLVAMKKQNPQTEDLLKRFNEVKQKLRALYQAQQQSRKH